MKKLLILALLFTGCYGGNPESTYYYCSNAMRSKMADWVLACVEKANPMSDEEPEHWTEQCERTARKLFCTENTRRPHFRTQDDPTIVWTK